MPLHPQVNFTTLMLGVHNIYWTSWFADHGVGTFNVRPDQILPMLWALHNMVPTFLFLTYVFAVNPQEDKMLRWACYICRPLVVAINVAAMVCLWLSNNDSGTMTGYASLGTQAGPVAG
jgi:hypothetical protein